MTDHRSIQSDLPPDRPSTPPGPGEPSNIEESSLYMRVIVWASELPWWAIILGTGLIAVLYLMLTSAIYQDILRQLTDNPQLETDELFEVVQVVGQPSAIEGALLRETSDTVETVVEQLLRAGIESELITRSGFIVRETPATLTIQTDDGRETVPKENITSETREETADGVRVTLEYIDHITVTGTLIERDDDTLHIRVVDQQTVTVRKNNIISQSTATVDGREITTIERRGDEITGRLTALSNTSVDVQISEGNTREFRLDDLEWYALPTLTIALNSSAAERTVTDGDEVRVAFPEGTDITEALATLDELENVPVPLRYADGTARVVLVPYPNLNAALLALNLGGADALIYLDATPERFAVAEWVEANPTANIELASPPRECIRECNVTVKLADDSVSGVVVDETDATLTLETVPEEVVLVDRDLIIETRREEPGVCALNNLRGCNEGIFLTLQVTVMAYILALIIGLIFGIMRVQSKPTGVGSRVLYAVTHNLATMYVEIVRGLPLLVILLYAGFVISPQIRDHTPLNLSDTQEAILGLSFGYGAFIAEIFRAGIQSIGRGQMEAARSLGMSYPQAMRYVILPQAIRVVLPPLGNDFIALLKDSALISVLALPDILQLGRLYISRTFLAIEGYNTVAVLYLMMTLFLSMLVRVIERRSRLPA